MCLTTQGALQLQRLDQSECSVKCMDGCDACDSCLAEEEVGWVSQAWAGEGCSCSNARFGMLVTTEVESEQLKTSLDHALSARWSSAAAASCSCDAEDIDMKGTRVLRHRDCSSMDNGPVPDALYPQGMLEYNSELRESPVIMSSVRSSPPEDPLSATRVRLHEDAS